MSNIKKANKTHIFRRATQILFFFILPGLFTQILTSLKTIVMSVSAGTFGVQANLFDILILASVILVTFFAGRFFCGWMCAFGAYGDFLAAVGGKLKIKRIKVPEIRDKFLKSIKYFVLAGLVIFVWGFQLVTIPSGISPMDAFGMLFSFTAVPNFSLIASSFLSGTVLLAAISVISLFIPRFFCRYLCPTGALLAVSSLARILHISKRREKCGKCSLCSYKCPMQIPLYKTDKMSSGECIQCAECVIGCPQKNCRMEINATAAAPVVAGMITVASITGLYYLGTFTSDALGSTSVAAAASSDTAASSASLNTSVSSSGAYEDGTYTGSGNGFRGTTKVTVTVQNGRITDIALLSKNDDAQYFNRAWDTIIALIISGQTTTVDAVSGATFSSNGIMEAVADALKGHETVSVTLSSADTQASAAGSSGQTASQSAVSSSQSSVSTQSTAAETAAGSSAGSSPAAAVIASLADGVYEGSGTGFRGETQVKVTVKDGKVTDIEIVSYQDDQQFFSRAQSGVIASIVSSQDPDVDAVSGATFSSNGIMEAVANALGISYENTNSQQQAAQGQGGGHLRS